MIRKLFFISMVCLTLYGCNGNSESSNNVANDAANSATNDVVNIIPQKSLADSISFVPDQQALENDINPSVFISALDLAGLNINDIASVSFSIKTKDGNFAKPLLATFDKNYLVSNSLYDEASNKVQIPIFGLYSNYPNDVVVKITFTDESVYSFDKTIVTAPYVDSAGIYDKINISLKPSSTPTYSYFYLKSSIKTPIILDVDGEVRWDADIKRSSFATIFNNNMFMTGSTTSKNIDTLNLYAQAGTMIVNGTAMGSDALFHHNIDPGKVGMLIEMDGTTDGKLKIESFLSEIDAQGNVIKEWDLGKIFSDYMTQNGDDPSNFVRDGVDWFHMNAATYDPSDDTLIVSSRENFVVKLDYTTGNIIWLLGDETKHWATYPSLQKLSLSLSTGQTPIGQHALSITLTGQLMMFNDGFASVNNPTGTPAGINLASSQSAIFAIDSAAKTAQVVWSFDDGIYSKVCSSVYEDKLSPQGDLLIDYAVADNVTRAIIQGVNKDKQKLFEFSYPTTNCNTSWNAIQLPLENIAFR